MRIDDLQIYRDARGAELFLLDLTDNFAKKYKFNTADRMIIQGWEMLDEVIAGCVEREPQSKINHFTAALIALSRLDTKMQLAAVKNQVTNEHLGQWMEIMNRIRRQLEGLVNSLQKKVRQSAL